MAKKEIQVPYEEIELKAGTRMILGIDNTKWRVLEVDRQRENVLLIADAPICVKAYHDRDEDITWEQCSLRKWLNGEYFEKTFSEQEKAAIPETELKNLDDLECGTSGGNDTKDRIFLLSIEEAQKYFKDDRDRSIDEWWWWLRSPGCNQNCAVIVHDDGWIEDRTVYEYGKVRPAFRINLESDLFQTFIASKSPEAIKLRIPRFHIREEKLISTVVDLEKAEIPEGVTELDESCFAGINTLKEVKLPSTLKKIGKKAFSGCFNLETITGYNGSIAYGKDAFEDCGKLQYSPEMYRNSGKLCDSFVEHLDMCGPEELAWLHMYQTGPVWDSVLPQKVTEGNAPEILCAMTKYITEQKKVPPKTGEAAAAFVVKYSAMLPGDEITKVCEALREKKCGEIATQLLEDPSVAARVNPNQTCKTDEKVMSDGSVWVGNVTEKKLELGTFLRFGGERWRVLKLDREHETVLVIAERPVCKKAYNDIFEETTWEQCSLRKWLNGEYYEKSFSEQEKAAILETEIKNLDNSKHGTPGRNDTKDRIFLLSIKEAKEYFKDDRDRSASTGWWLRSPGHNRDNAALVGAAGSLNYFKVNYNDFAVRPALRINLNSDLFESYFSSDQNEECAVSWPELIVKSGTVIDANPSLEEVMFPEYVKKISSGAFYNCWKLKSITWPGEAPEIAKDAFVNCNSLRLPASYYWGKKLPDESFVRYFPEDDTAIANALLTAEVKSHYRWKAANMLSEKNASAVADELIRLIEEWKGIKQPETVLLFCLAAVELLTEEQLEKLKSLLAKTKYTGTGWLRKNRDAEKKPGLYREAFQISSAVLQADCGATEKLPCFPEVYAATKPYAELYLQDWVDPKGYRKDALETYRKDARADQLASLMDHNALMELLKTWQVADGPEWYAPYAVFANDQELTDLIAEMKIWEKDKNLREQIIRVRGAILLNDTVTAMRYADSLGHLERYAKLRGMNADDIRDNIISDFGLDENGKKTWAIAGKMVTAFLNPDLTLSLTDENGKLMKSVPKKGADPAEYEAVNKEFTAMKKDIKATAKTRNDKVFADFLSGRSRPGMAWK